MPRKSELAEKRKFLKVTAVPTVLFPDFIAGAAVRAAQAGGTPVPKAKKPKK